MTTDQTSPPDFDQQALSRFWAKVNKTDTCWSWTGSTDQYGYGQFWVNGRRYAVHRLSYLMAHGDIPKGLVVDHLCHGWDANCKAEGNWCHHRACVNPEHLEAITHRENLLRGHGVSGEAARRTYCPHGHPYDEANTYFNGGTRRCRACREARKAAERTVLPPAERTHCPQGHPYDEENTYRRPNGTRSCRACRSRRNRRSGQGEPRGLAPSRVDGELEQHRLTLSLTLGLGTGAPWDAIHEQVALLRRVAAEEQPAETQDGTTADKAAALGLTDTDYRARSHAAAVATIRAAIPGMYAHVGFRLEDVLNEADEVQPPETQAHEPTHTWTVESPRRDNWASWGTTYDDRDWALESYEHSTKNAPARPFRLVRATTTYTIEAEHTPPTARPAVGEQPETQEAPRCVCGDPVQLMDEADPTSWIHSPGSDTRCLDARPRCPHCQMPHDLTPDSLPAAVCASTRQRIADAAQAHTLGDHSGCCRVDCDVLQAVAEQPETQEAHPPYSEYRVENYDAGAWQVIGLKRKTLADAQEVRDRFRRGYPDARLRIIRRDESVAVVETDPEPQP